MFPHPKPKIHTHPKPRPLPIHHSPHNIHNHQETFPQVKK